MSPSYSSAHPKDAHLMDDADLAGPLIFCFLFGVFLLLVSLAALPTSPTLSYREAMFQGERDLNLSCLGKSNELYLNPS